MYAFNHFLWQLDKVHSFLVDFHDSAAFVQFCSPIKFSLSCCEMNFTGLEGQTNKRTPVIEGMFFVLPNAAEETVYSAS